MHNVLDAPGVSLREILPSASASAGKDLRITSCCSDSRCCRRGDLFVALVGDRQDGHDFANDAVRRGAGAVLAERPLPVNVPVYVVPDTREAFGQICQTLAGRPSEPMRVIGVAGAGGKTTTNMLIASMLRAARRTVGAINSIRRCDSVETTPSSRTTPPPPELARWMARMAANGCSHAVIEVSRRALSQRYLAGVQFDAVVLTGCSGEGWDRRGPASNSFSSETRLLQQLKPGGFAVINSDDPAARALLSNIHKPSITVAMETSAEVTASLVERHKSEQTFLVTAGNETVPVRTRMIGTPHVYNCLAAAAVGLVLGVDLTTVVRGLESLDSLPGRLERIECGQPFGVFVDYADTPPLLSMALRTLRPVTTGRLICVVSAGASDHAEYRPNLGRIAERLADLNVITTDHRRREPPLQIIHDILDGCAHPGRPRVMPDRHAAIRWALSQARPGDTLLVAGLDRCDEEAWDAAGCSSDDRDVIRSHLYEAGADDRAQRPQIRIYRGRETGV